MTIGSRSQILVVRSTNGDEKPAKTTCPTNITSPTTDSNKRVSLLRTGCPAFRTNKMFVFYRVNFADFLVLRYSTTRKESDLNLEKTVRNTFLEDYYGRNHDFRYCLWQSLTAVRACLRITTFITFLHGRMLFASVMKQQLLLPLAKIS